MMHFLKAGKTMSRLETVRRKTQCPTKKILSIRALTPKTKKTMKYFTVLTNPSMRK